MKPGASKTKGGNFERAVCTALSLWITDGKRKDIFWRSALSGGRSTIHGKSVAQAGDITAVALEGHAMLQQIVIECKHLKQVEFEPLFNGKGELAVIWKKIRNIASEHLKLPVLIIRRNNRKTLFITNATVAKLIGAPVRAVFYLNPAMYVLDEISMHVCTLDDVLSLPPPISWVTNGVDNEGQDS